MRGMGRRLYRSGRDRIIAGVCGGLGEYFETDPLVFRLLFVALAILYLPASVAAYLLAALLIPPRPGEGGGGMNFERIRNVILGVVMGVIGFWVVVGALSSGLMKTFTFPGSFNAVAIFVTPVVAMVGAALLLAGAFLLWRGLSQAGKPQKARPAKLRFKSAA